MFANNVDNGFRQAEMDLGPDATYYFSDWDPNKMLQQIQQAVATQVDGIATYGFAGEPATGPIVDQAFAQGTIFTSLNTSLPESQKKYAASGFGYVGAPNYSASFALAAKAVKRCSLAAGDSVFVWGLKGQGGDRGQRTVGVMGANPCIKIVVTDHGGLTSNVGVYAQAAGLTPGQVYFAGFDMSPNTAQAVKDGFQNLVIDQQPFLQGYLPILNICLTKKYGFSGLDVNTAGAFVDATNVDAVAPLAAIEIR